MDHYKSQYVRDFLKGLKEQDIGYTIIPLAAPDVTEVVSVVWRGLGGAPEIVLGGMEGGVTSAELLVQGTAG
jgi:hypothetical protein